LECICWLDDENRIFDIAGWSNDLYNWNLFIIYEEKNKPDIYGI